MAATISVRTAARAQMIDITADVAAVIPASFSGVCLVFCRHTTAGLTINENADPDVVHDVVGELDRLVPLHNRTFRHREGNSAAHVKSTLCGVSVAVPVESGKMLLGVWQSIFFCEFDGPRSRRVVAQLLPGQEPPA